MRRDGYHLDVIASLIFPYALPVHDDRVRHGLRGEEECQIRKPIDGDSIS